MTFQALDGKERQFLDLMDNNFNVIEPSYTKGGPQLQTFSYSNSLCVCATRAITNHAPIGKYQLRFFPSEEFRCPCGNYPIESRRHILHDCTKFNGYWNPRQDSLSHFVMFLVANPCLCLYRQLYFDCSKLTLEKVLSFFSLYFLLFCSYDQSFSFLYLFSLFFYFLLHVSLPLLYIVTKQLPRSALALRVINC